MIHPQIQFPANGAPNQMQNPAQMPMMPNQRTPMQPGYPPRTTATRSRTTATRLPTSRSTKATRLPTTRAIKAFHRGTPLTTTPTGTKCLLAFHSTKNRSKKR